MNQKSASVLLVHGAWHGSWCWERVVPLLRARGVAVATLDLPSVHADASARSTPERPLSDDAAAVRAAAASLGGPVVLCGHSYGGMVISLAAAGPAMLPGGGRFARLVYLCAFMPQAGESLLAIGGNRPAPWIQLREDGTALPDLTRAAEVFYGDCDEATQRWAVSQIRPQRAAAYAEVVPEPAWKQIPSTYVICSRDAAIPPPLQRDVFAPRASAVRELAASHSPFLSQPQALAELLAEAARTP